MHIALCHENVLPHRGGAEMYVADLARRLTAAGHDVHLFACRWDATALPTRMPIHALPMPTGPRFLRPWRFAASVRRALARHRPEVSVGFDKLFCTDVLYPLGGFHAACAVGNRRRFACQVQRGLARVIQTCDLAQRSYLLQERLGLREGKRPVVVANSRMVRDHAAMYYGIPASQVPVVHNAIDPDRFPEADRPRVRDEVRRQFGLTPDDVVGVHVAMNYRLKGLDCLLRALARIPASRPFKLLVAGSRKTAPYERLADRLGVRHRVAFMGHCPEVRRAFFAADLLLHPTFYDPCSLVVLEANACGLPVVTTAFNGASELLADGRVLADPHDTTELAGAIEEFLDPARRQAASRAARQAAAGWTFDLHCRKLLEVFETVAARRAA